MTNWKNDFETRKMKNFSRSTVEEALNPAVTRLSVVLLLDLSGSMNNEGKLPAAQDALDHFRASVMEIPECRASLEVCVIGYNEEIHELVDFVPITAFEAPKLSASGLTYTAQAMMYSADKLRQRHQLLSENGIQSYRPIIVHITDGGANNDESDTKRAVSYIRSRCSELGGTNRLKVWQFGTEGADFKGMKQYGSFVVKIGEQDYRSIFNWLADSFRVLSQSSLEISADGELKETNVSAPPLQGSMQFIPDDVFNA